MPHPIDVKTQQLVSEGEVNKSGDELQDSLMWGIVTTLTDLLEQGSLIEINDLRTGSRVAVSLSRAPDRKEYTLFRGNSPVTGDSIKSSGFSSTALIDLLTTARDDFRSAREQIWGSGH